MTTTSDEAALLRAIAANPEADLPRLMYADCIDESATDVQCPQCLAQGKPSSGAFGQQQDEPWVCGRCRGSGVVSDGRAERAEFIRLQIALAGPDAQLPRCEACNGTKRVTAMAYPEAAYDPEPHEVEIDCRACICPKKYVLTGTARRAMEFRVAELWHKSVWKQLSMDGVYVNHAGTFTPPEKPTVVVSRGFAETLYLPTLADLCERDLSQQCPACGARGEVHLGGWEQCATCFGQGRVPGDYTGKPTKLALDIMRAHPTITRVVVGDRRPWHAFDASMESIYQFVAGDFYDHTGERIPREILAEVAKLGIGKVRENSERCVIDFAANQAALDALAVAAGQWLRSHTQGESQ